jgi:hypothetical protein
LSAAEKNSGGGGRQTDKIKWGRLQNILKSIACCWIIAILLDNKLDITELGFDFIQIECKSIIVFFTGNFANSIFLLALDGGLTLCHVAMGYKLYVISTISMKGHISC